MAQKTFREVKVTPISIISLPAAQLDPDYSGSGLGGSGHHQLINPSISQSPSPSRFDLKPPSSIKGRFVKSGETSGANQMVVKVTPMEVKIQK